VKYVSKDEGRSKSYNKMLIRVVGGSGFEAPTLSSYRRFLVETLVECDIGAKETYHMLLKIPLVVYSRKIFLLNFSKKVY